MSEYYAFYVDENVSEEMVAILTRGGLDCALALIHGIYPNASWSGDITLNEIKEMQIPVLEDWETGWVKTYLPKD